MRMIGDVIISEEAWGTRFSCDLGRCRGECCRIGDLGSPLGDDEVELLNNRLSAILPLVPENHAEFLRGGFCEKYEGKWHIREIGTNHPCPFSFRNGVGTILCSVHRLAVDLGTGPESLKPLWCSLFPLTIDKTPTGWRLNLRLAPFCVSSPDPPPILLSFKGILSHVFGREWFSEVEEELDSQ